MEIWRTCALCGGGWDAKCTYRFYVVVCAPLRRPRRYVYDSVCLCVCVCRRRRRPPSRVRCSRIVPRHACVCGHVRGALPPMLCTPAGRAEPQHTAKKPPTPLIHPCLWCLWVRASRCSTLGETVGHTVLSSWLPRLKTLKNAAKEEGGAVISHYYQDFLLRPHAARDIQL